MMAKGALTLEQWELNRILMRIGSPCGSIPLALAHLSSGKSVLSCVGGEEV